MAKYKILVIAHSLKNNLVGKCNEVVDESQLTSDVKGLVDAGFIELVVEPTTETKVETKAETETSNIEVVEEKVVVAKKPKTQK
jgi:DNA-binding HxlR family transcriptional regulator